MSAIEAMQEALKAEHAAVYGYGVLGSKLRGGLQQYATSAWDGHRAQRDQLIGYLTARGAEPVAAAPAYRLPVKAVSSRTAAQLAAALEDDLVTAYVGLAGVPGEKLRTLAARSMQQAMSRAVHWRAGTGQPSGPASAFPGLPTSALTPKPQPGE